MTKIQQTLLQSLVVSLPPGNQDKAIKYLDSLVSTTNEELADELLDTLQNGDSELRVFVANALGLLRERKAFSILMEKFQDQHEDITLRRVAGSSLAFMRDKRATSPFITMLNQDHSNEIKAVIAYAIGWLPPNRRATNALISLLGNHNVNSFVRGRAAESLGILKSKSAVVDLIDNLNDEAIEVRFFSVRSLGQIGDTRAIPALQKLADIDKEVYDILPDGGPLNEEALKAIELINSSSI